MEAASSWEHPYRSTRLPAAVSSVTPACSRYAAVGPRPLSHACRRSLSRPSSSPTPAADMYRPDTALYAAGCSHHAPCNRASLRLALCFMLDCPCTVQSYAGLKHRDDPSVCEGLRPGAAMQLAIPYAGWAKRRGSGTSDVDQIQRVYPFAVSPTTALEAASTHIRCVRRLMSPSW